MRLLRQLLVPILICASCAPSVQAPNAVTVDTAIRGRAPSGIRVEGAAPMPPGVTVDDGVTSDEAVAIALWNSPSFQATLADLGLAHAGVVDAGLLRNPILSLLFPIGTKQFEWTVQFPLEVFWQRPRRIAAAQLNAQAVGERLVWDALSLVADTRTAHADAAMADRRLALAVSSADLVQRLTEITEARLRAGDISELDARSARHEAARARAARDSAEAARDLTRLTLTATMGLDSAEPVRAIPPRAIDPAACGDESRRLKEALASRPDVRAAEITIEAAAARAKWERSRVLTLIGILDGNSNRNGPADAGPGIGTEIPLFSRNQGNISRADAEVERASRRYAALRAQVSVDIRSAAVRTNYAVRAVSPWRDEIIPSLEIEQRQAEAAYRAGEIPLFSLLDASRRLLDARARLLDAEADLQHATIALERSIGHACVPAAK